MWPASACCEPAQRRLNRTAAVARAVRTGAAVAAVFSLGGPARAADVQLDNPRGGWRVQGLLEDPDRPAVTYPYNLIDRGAQTGRVLIQGRLAALAARAASSASAATSAAARPARSRYTMVINGNAMPLYTDDDGRFVRPYAFGAGSNSVEIRRDGGPSGKRVQFLETRGAGAPAALRIIAAWDDNQAEVDMHVLTPDGQHAFWGAPVLRGGGGLDVDSVDGAGPEMFSLTQPLRGTYHIYVNYWGNFGGGGYHFDERTRQRPVITVRLTVITRENTPAEKRQTFVVPLRRIGDLTWVYSLAW